MWLEWRNMAAEIPEQRKDSTPDHRGESQPTKVEKSIDDGSSKDSTEMGRKDVPEVQEDRVPSERHRPSRRVRHKGKVCAWLSSLVLLVVVPDGSGMTAGAVSGGPASAVATFFTEGESLSIDLFLVDWEPIEGSGRMIRWARRFVTIGVATLIVAA